jgi:hypothetical protein
MSYSVELTLYGLRLLHAHPAYPIACQRQASVGNVALTSNTSRLNLLNLCCRLNRFAFHLLASSYLAQT